MGKEVIQKQWTRNIALMGDGGIAKSWDTRTIIPNHELYRANDGYIQSYWIGRFEDMPVDLGIEWEDKREISAIAVRYLDARLVPDYIGSRLQKWTSLQYWNNSKWQDIEYDLKGVGTNVNWYIFDKVTTTRIRLIYHTPFVFTGRTFEMGNWYLEPHLPLNLLPGIYVCELEAYRKLPVKQIEQLMVEPELVRVFKDKLMPTLMVSETKWAQEKCVVQQSGNCIRLENGFIELEVELRPYLKEIKLKNKVCDIQKNLDDSTVFRLLINEKQLLPEDFRVNEVKVDDIKSSGKRIKIRLNNPNLEIIVIYRLRQKDHFYHKWLMIENRTDETIVIKDIALSSQGLPNIVYLASPEDLSYPVSQLENGGFFGCIEFPYWEHKLDTLMYYPGIKLEGGKSYETERAAIGVYKNRGEMVMYMDLGIREWVVEYHTHVSSIGEEWPERYHEGWDAYFRIKAIDSQPKWVEDYVERMRKLGIEFSDGYEPVHQAMEMPEEAVQRWVNVCYSKGVRAGSWIDHGSSTSWDRGTAMAPFKCKLSPECQKYFKKVVEFAKKNNYKCMHHDFFFIYPCNNPDHGHLPGKYSIYPQAKALIDFDRNLHEACPGIMTSGDGTFGSAQWTRLLDGRVHGIIADHYEIVQPDIHLDRLCAEFSRGYMLSGYFAFLHPWFRTLNCVSHFGQETHLHDRAGFRYSILSAIAMAPQVCFNDIPENIPDEEIEFAGKWLTWAAQNKDYFRECSKLFLRHFSHRDAINNMSEALEGFAHIKKDKGFISLINPSAQKQITLLDLQLNTEQKEKFIVKEVYPKKFNVRGPKGGYYEKDDEIKLSVPAKNIRILWIEAVDDLRKQVEFKDEDFALEDNARFIEKWDLLSKDDKSIVLKGKFYLPKGTDRYLTSIVEKELWQSNPWAYDKAYAVIILKNDVSDIRYNWIRDDLRIKVRINGVDKDVVSFRTSRNQKSGLCRCYFSDIAREAKTGQWNKIELTLPQYFEWIKIRQGLTFKGIYIDLPDQMPYVLP